jgi:hypothetical protein
LHGRPFLRASIGTSAKGADGPFLHELPDFSQGVKIESARDPNEWKALALQLDDRLACQAQDGLQLSFFDVFADWARKGATIRFHARIIFCDFGKILRS